jgi:ubiquinone/menaquinone biosynthesis C-methylase UbiE
LGFYADRVLPHLVNLAMRNRRLTPYRQRVAGAATGRVLEIGAGSGLNLPFYTSRVDALVALDPSPRLMAMTRRAAADAPVPIEAIEGSAETLPLDDRSIDSVVTTWALCSIADIHRALGEVRRVLKPGGQLLFVEHGLSPEPRVQAWQDRLTPIWRPIAGGCHLNRPIRDLIEGAGFAIRAISTGYIPGPKIMTYLIEGRAQPR